MASNLRVLVSNMDGNWGHWNYDTGALDTKNLLRQALDGESAYFPPGGVSGAGAPLPPDASQMFFSSVDYAGWNSKSNWIFQVAGTWDGATITVSVGRPTGVEEVVATRITSDFTWGGCSSIDATTGANSQIYENLVGPITYVRFALSGAGGSTDLRCYVIAWNEGDIYDGVAKNS
tara:strand:- start:1072 stop:1599 length:528 start_codon:yes stop_codon:yes gene_type:complete